MVKVAFMGKWLKNGMWDVVMSVLEISGGDRDTVEGRLIWFLGNNITLLENINIQDIDNCQYYEEKGVEYKLLKRGVHN